MDFIERIFHVAPDAGNGTLELAFVLVFLMLLLGVAALRLGVVRRYAGNARVKMLYHFCQVKIAPEEIRPRKALRSRFSNWQF